uniref:hypothetical protein n=1 Tax=Photobacterium halotolerans TaxID=265726 RepID=UPI000489880E
QNNLKQANSLMAGAARTEARNNQLETQAEHAEDMADKQTIGTAAGMGLRAGMSEAGKKIATDAGTALTRSEATTIGAHGETVQALEGATGSFAQSPVTAGAVEGGAGISASAVPNAGVQGVLSGAGTTTAGAGTTAATTAATTATTAATGAGTAATGAGLTSAATTAATTAATATTAAAAGTGATAGPLGMLGGAALGILATKLF